MPVFWIVLIVLALGAAGYVVGRRGAVRSAGGDTRVLHSLPGYHGTNVFIYTAVPALLVLACWLLLQPMVIQSTIGGRIPDSAIPENSTRGLVMSDVRRMVGAIDAAVATGRLAEGRLASTVDVETLRTSLDEAGVPMAGAARPEVLETARAYRNLAGTGNMLMAVVVLGLAAGGLAFSIRRVGRDFRARNAVERGILALLILASTIAILTTAGIVASLVFETMEFFRMYPWQDFLFGLTWSPQFRGNSQLGMLPLLWGTLYVSFIALLVAVPVGLFAAIYMSEYASRRFRSVAKPLIEILAGIPTIVYGLFALVTVGPLLRDYFARPMGLGESSSSVMTAGLVMGIMLIPFVSSLSDDIINAVPQSLRDGSLGLGATKSETIRQVIVPAALPGIIGAILLAASRAIGETMIVVLGAGAAARLDLNPFEAMTTITVKIVGQLTGDTDFGSPETLVAFALGLTLFVITLALNILALYIVRKYREQYE
ncbi:phosphate ABC transporter permease subunit PstC [Halodurantibacterium flavum]|uniref:Phosphate transport system permease protein n=1 Tax=Halodurantibacterium flavum TaxID=1382802 RepID=A0ABW4RZZ0_9RHOB